MALTHTYDGDALLPIGDVSRLLGVGLDTLRRWEKEGRLPAASRTPGGQRRWRASDIEALVAGRTRDVAS